MKKLLFLTCFTALVIAGAAQTEYSSFGGSEKEFNNKYKLTAVLNEAEKKLEISSTAPVAKIILTVYTQQEMAVRKGTDHTKTFTRWPGTYTYDLEGTAFKDKFAYWLKVYTSDGLSTEYVYQKKKKDIVAAKPITERKPATQEAKKPTAQENDAQEEIKTDDGGTVIKTTIHCKPGSEKVDAALRELEGVFDVKIDITSGKLTIHYSSDGTPFMSILDTIRANGFDANGQKTTNPTADPCKVKPSRG